jgi:hypothetical protein
MLHEVHSYMISEVHMNDGTCMCIWMMQHEFRRRMNRKNMGLRSHMRWILKLVSLDGAKKIIT